MSFKVASSIIALITVANIPAQSAFILLKLSGEALSASDFPFNTDTLKEVSRQVKEISNLGVKVGIVVGGGNICRGRIFESLGFDRVKADYAGMLATVINAIMLESTLNNLGVKAKALSVIEAQNVERYDFKRKLYRN